MRRRVLIVLGVAAVLTAGTGTAHASTGTAGTTASVTGTAPSGSGSGCATGVLAPLGDSAKNLHWSAEYLLQAAGLQPIFSIIDKPVIHPLLWTPLGALTCTQVDSHPWD